MKIYKAKKLAKRLRNKHGLRKWKIIFGTSFNYGDQSIIASCSVDCKTFEFNPAFFSINEEWFCKDQILHEIAHALAGWKAKHGKIWKAKCVEIGAIPYELFEGFHPNYNNPFF